MKKLLLALVLAGAVACAAYYYRNALNPTVTKTVIPKIPGS